MRKICLVILSIFLTNIPILSAQSIFYEVSIEDQISNSEFIIEGKVVSKKSYFDVNSNHIYTINTVAAIKSFKGQDVLTNNFFVLTKGGTVGYNSELVQPSVQLSLGDRGVFFLEKATIHLENFSKNEKIFKAYSGVQGFYKYNKTQQNFNNPFLHKEGSDFFDTLQLLIGKPLKVLKEISINASKNLQSAQITSFTPSEIRAGTGDTVTLFGNNFGVNQGEVSFENADLGGGASSFSNTFQSDIISWTNSRVEIRVPQFAGTGKIRISTQSGGDFVTSNDLIVLSAETNGNFDTNNDGVADAAFRIKLFDTDFKGGYTWVYNGNFGANNLAVSAFERSLNEWICLTGISWSIDTATTSLSKTEADNVNLVRFESPNKSPNDEIEFGTLAVATSYFSGCFSPREGGIAELVEVDLTFNSDINWNFEQKLPSFNQIDFQGTATHELGHAHNMGHVISEGQLMHFNTPLGSNSATRTIDNNTAIGAKSNFAFSKTGLLCSRSNDVISDKDCPSEVLSVDNFTGESSENLIIYQTQETIEIISNNFNSVTVFNLNGEVVFTGVDSSIIKNQFPSGVYIIMVEAAGDNIFRKIFTTL